MPPVPQMGRELRGSTLGLIGYGQIARHLAPVATALGMRVLVSDPYVRVDAPRLEQVEFAALLQAADFVVCLAPATPATANLIDAGAFAAMKPGAYFINASRGELVDEQALSEALDTGRLAGCALDVGRAPDQMPTPALAAHPRVIATPHVGGLTLPAVEHQAARDGRSARRAARRKRAARCRQRGACLAAGALAHGRGRYRGGRAMRPDTPTGRPADACDCHIHIYDDAYPLAPTATFRPPHAPVDAYRRVQQTLGLQPAS